MNLPPEILLLSTYELGHIPLGLTSPLGFLARAGHRARGIDLSVEPLDEDAVRGARFIGISVPMHTALRLALAVAKRLRALNPHCHLCFYGLYAPLNHALLTELGANSVLGGEYEEALQTLVADQLRPGERTAQSAAPQTILSRLDFAPPLHDGLPPLHRYARLVTADGSLQLAGYTEASRGCLHHCRHCPVPSVYEGRFFVVPEAIVLADVDRQVALGAAHVTLGDPDFLNGPNHAMRVARAIHRAHPNLTFDVTVKIEHILVHRSLLPELRQLGCLFVTSAVESLSDRILELLDKGHTAADVDQALALVRAAGLVLRPSLVAFTPWTTLADYLALLTWIERQALVDVIDPIQLAIRLLIPPHSKLLDLVEVQRLVGPLDAVGLTYPWVHPDGRMDLLQRAIYAAVEEAARVGEEPRDTFGRIEALARATREGGRHPSAAAVRANERQQGPPRLTEPWFC